LVEHLNGAIDWLNTKANQAYPHILCEAPPSLPQLQLSYYLIVLYFGIIVFAIASTLCMMYCPERVQDFSLAEWGDQHNNDPINYVPLPWKSPKIRRWSCYLYWAGFLSIVGVAVIKTGFTLFRIITALSSYSGTV